MNNNDILIRLRYALNISDSTMIEIFKLSGYDIENSALSNLLKKEDAQGHVSCADNVMELFLDGLILHKRGRKEIEPGTVKNPAAHLANNIILKKIRIALELKEDDMIGILKLAGFDVSKSQLSALFRKKGHKNYKECGDQFIRNFLKGLTVRYRK